MLEAWRVNTSYWISLFKQDTEKVASGFNPDDDTMGCFAQNPEACADYYGCPYINFCMAWPNPLAHFDEIPLGFKREYWDPTIMELDKEVTL
jgi:hypothetical protein